MIILNTFHSTTSSFSTHFLGRRNLHIYYMNCSNSFVNYPEKTSQINQRLCYAFRGIKLKVLRFLMKRDYKSCITVEIA